MILDWIGQAGAYQALHPGIAPVLAYLKSKPLVDLAPGKYEIDGDRLSVIIGREMGRGPGARLEAHKKYLDIQVPLSAPDKIGWKAIDTCREPEPFDDARDIGFFNDLPDLFVEVPVGAFVMFLPQDCHAPLSGTAEVLKAVFKIRAAW